MTVGIQGWWEPLRQIHPDHHQPIPDTASKRTIPGTRGISFPLYWKRSVAILPLSGPVMRSLIG